MESTSSRAGRRVDGVEIDAVISAQTPAVATGGAPRRHAGARLGHDGARDGGGGLDDLALHDFTCEVRTRRRGDEAITRVVLRVA